MFDRPLAIVSGAARGIGRAIAVKLAHEGYDLVLSDLLEPELEECASQARESGGGVVSSVCDATKPDDVDALYAKVDALNQAPAVLVNNAFAERRAYLGEIGEDAWNFTLNSTLTTAFLMCNRSLPRMCAAGGGAIVNVASIHAFGARETFGPYEAAKAGLVSLTRTIAVEYGNRGVRANAVCPGLVITERNQARWLDRPDDFSAILRAYPMGRAGTPEEIANVVSFVAGGAASFVNGAIITVDGGSAAMLAESAALGPDRIAE